MHNWYALHVKSRHEFVARDELAKKGIETYLPTARKLRFWKDRKKLVDFPLFPGYLFVQSAPNPEEFLRVLKTRGAVNLVSLEPGQPATVPPEEINSLRILLESDVEFDVYPNLKEGARVRVRRGPLRGAEGVLTKREEQHTFTVNIEILGRGVSVRINAEEIEPC
jgi:transcription antitermination factor NusG